MLVAPPGAGKTTLVPLALLEAPWRGEGKIVVLEPRRVAARGAAERMADLLGEKLGERVGLRARFDVKTSTHTRIEVVTEGVFARLIIDDPELTGIAAVLFDEFHERALDADFGLALALEAQAALRPDLRVLVMSATLDGARVSALLGDAPVITSEGRAFPVETRYRPRKANAQLEDEMVSAIRSALAQEPGSILAFLPGQGEIIRVADRLAAANLPPNVRIRPLYGALDPAAQADAIRPAAPETRKIVLATAIAETSLTLEGVRVVIDSGLSRLARFEPDLGITRLETVRASKASVDQRRGRAGRTQPGVCYRLWEEAQTSALPAFAAPEILESDLASFRLDCARWGTLPNALKLLDPPPAGALLEAEKLLAALGALDDQGRITTQGTLLRTLPVHPRLAALVLKGASLGCAEEGALAAALISEGAAGGSGVDLVDRWAQLARNTGARAKAIRNMAQQWARRAQAHSQPGVGQPEILNQPPRQNQAHNVLAHTVLAHHALSDDTPLPVLVAEAFPDRVGKNRGKGVFALANGRQAHIEEAAPLAYAPYIVALDLTGKAARARITLALAISRAQIETALADRLQRRDETRFDPVSGRLYRRQVTSLGALTLDSVPLAVEPGEKSARALALAAAKAGIDRLPWSKDQQHLRDRVVFLRHLAPTDWPDLTQEALADKAEEWLTPYLHHATSLADLNASVLGEALAGLLPYFARARLEQEAPTHFTAPTGNAHPICYSGEGAPSLAIRVQELFGLTTHPSVAEGRLPLTLELLSPAHRPVQITRDLPAFWAGSWADVRADMRGRYPKHVWPENPATVLPTARAKPRGS